MSINRNNYEEYFLLYMDNELSAEERKMVDDFVLLNQDLAAELEALMALRLDPDDNIIFTDKQDLLKPVHEESTTEEKEVEKLLLFIDGELKESEIPAFKKELNKNASLQKALELFKQTKLTPDMSVVFPDKSVLYRHEKQPARILVMRMISISVAAAVILIAGLLWMNTPETEMEQPGIALAQAETPEQVTKPESTAKEQEPQQVMTGSSTTGKTEPDQTDAPIASVTKSSPATKESAENFNRFADNRSTEKNNSSSVSNPVSGQRISAPVIASLDNNTQRQTENLTTPATRQAPADAVAPQLVAQNIIDRPSVSEIKSDYATEALMSAQESVEVVQADTDDDRRGPMRGLFRKANRFFNKVTNPDKDGPTVKVASFEIALAK